MQKKIIALAVAGLVSGAAFAQSNVEIYGSIDMGYLYQGDNKNSAIDDRNGIDSGIGKANRLGFKGTEDLGNGLKASFTYEMGLNGGDGSNFMAATQNRQSFLALSGNFGTVAVGRQYTPQHVFYGAVDPFYNDNIGQVGNVIIKDVRLDNLAAYVSPTLFGGFTFIGGYTSSYGGNESAGNETTATTILSEDNLKQDASVWALAAKYENGPIFAGFNYHAASTNSANTALDGIDVSVWDIMGTYDFGIVKLHGSYGSREVDNVASTDQWMLGLSAPLGNGRALFSYVDRSTDMDNALVGDPDISQWAIGYDYNVSKRTVAYVQYAQQDQNDAAKAAATGAGLTNYGASVGTSTSGTGNNYQQGFSIGVKHSF